MTFPQRIVHHLLIHLLMLMLCSCATSPDSQLAPISSGVSIDRKMHRAQPGESLVSIAWQYDKEPAELAYYNGIDEYAILKPNQLIYLAPVTVKGGGATSPVLLTERTNRASKSMESNRSQPLCWHSPVSGQPITRFDPRSGQKGINFASKVGYPVRAVQAGKVIYSGRGIQGYGNLIIIRHADFYLTAYAFNRRNLVTEGQKVAASETIAEVGSDSELRQGILHFEIRRLGKPLNPTKYLNSCGNGIS